MFLKDKAIEVITTVGGRNWFIELPRVWQTWTWGAALSSRLPEKEDTGVRTGF